MAKREKPPIEWVNGLSEKYDGVTLAWDGDDVSIVAYQQRIEMSRKAFDEMVRWYTGTETKQPRATKGTR